MSLVLAASMGAKSKAEIPVAAVAIRTVAVGDIDANIVLSEKDGVAERAISDSAMPKTAARKLRKNVSNVRIRMLYMNVEFVPRQIARAPL